VKFVCRTRGRKEGAVNQEFALIELTPEVCKTILQERRTCLSFLELIHGGSFRRVTVNAWRPAQGIPINPIFFDNYWANNPYHDAFEELEDNWLPVEETFTPPEDNIERMVCEKLHYDATDIWIQATDNYNDSYPETPDMLELCKELTSK